MGLCPAAPSVIPMTRTTHLERRAAAAWGSAGRALDVQTVQAARGTALRTRGAVQRSPCIVSALPQVTEDELKAAFEVHGEVSAVKPCHKGGYGFVTFKEHAAAVAAIVAMNGRELKGKVCVCCIMPAAPAGVRGRRCVGEEHWWCRQSSAVRAQSVQCAKNLRCTSRDFFAHICLPCHCGVRQAMYGPALLCVACLQGSNLSRCAVDCKCCRTQHVAGAQHAQAIKCSWGRHQPSRQLVTAAPPAYTALPGGYPAGGGQHMYGAAGMPAVPNVPVAGQPGMYTGQPAQAGSAYQPQLVYSVSASVNPARRPHA